MSPSRMKAAAAAGALTIAVALAVFAWMRLPRYPTTPEPVSFSNGDVHLAGILVGPKTPGPHPAIVFIHGSGPSTTDDPIWTYHAAAFVKRGFAVLVYDKRGSGRSSGSLETADYQDLAGDVIAAVRYLRTRADIQGNDIGLLGRSEGGWVAPLAAAQLDSIAFIVFSAGPTVPQLEETLFLANRAMRRRGMTEAAADSAIDARRIAMKAAGATSTGAAAIPFYDPQPALSALRVPLLALYAGKDEAIPTDTCIAVLRHLQRHGHRNITIRTFPHVGHNFLLWRRPPIFAFGYLREMAQFAAEHTQPR